MVKNIYKHGNFLQDSEVTHTFKICMIGKNTFKALKCVKKTDEKLFRYGKDDFV